VSDWLNWLWFAALVLLIVGAFFGVYHVRRWLHRTVDAWFDVHTRG